MSRKRLKIRIGPRRLEGAVVSGGRVVAQASAPIDHGVLEEAWSDGLRPLDGPFYALMQQLAVHERLDADVLYEAADTAAEVISVPVSGKSAHDAALLAMTDRVAFPLHTNPVATRVIGTDRSGEQRRTHVLVSADREETANSVVMWLERNGAVAGRLAPTPSPAIVSLVGRVLAEGSAGSRVLAYVGAQNTVFVGARDGSLMFVRTVDLGYELLADVYERVLGTSAGDPAARESAIERLFRIGVPGRNDVIDSLTGTKGSTVLPMLHPALQRMAVECKHTVRFGLDEGGRTAAVVELLGPGSGVPRLDEALTAMTEMPVNVGEGDSSREGDGGLPSELATAAEEGEQIARLLPAKLAERETRRRLSAPLRIGAVAAIAALVGEGILTHHRRTLLEEEARANEAALAEVRETDEAWQRGVKASEDVAEVRRALVDAVGIAPDWGAVLAELSRVGGDDIRLFDLSAERRGERARLTLRGYVRTGTERTRSLAAYVQRLRESPLFSAVELGSTRAAEIDDEQATQFSLGVELGGRTLRIAGGEGETW